MIRSLDGTVYHYDNHTNSWSQNYIYDAITCSNIIFNGKPKLALPEIDKVIFHAPATVIIFKDGTKSVVKCSEHDEYDPEKGFAMALLKHALGKKKYKTVFKKYVKKA